MGMHLGAHPLHLYRLTENMQEDDRHMEQI